MRVAIRASMSEPFAPVVARQIDDLAAAITAGVRTATLGARDDWRQTIVAVGLGRRLANAIGAEVYPKGRDSLGAAGLIFPRGASAMKIIEAFSEGVVIRPKNGASRLAIPTENTPRVARGGRGGTRPMTPVEVEAAFNQDLISIPVKGKPGVSLLAVRAQPGRARRAARRRLKTGRTADLIPMFVAVRAVRHAKRMDPDAIVLRRVAQTPTLIEQHLSRASG